MTIVVRIGRSTLAHTPDGAYMDFETLNDAVAWTYIEGLYQGASVDVARAHGVQGDELDGWTKHGLYLGAVIEMWDDSTGVGGENWRCVIALRALFPEGNRWTPTPIRSG